MKQWWMSALTAVLMATVAFTLAPSVAEAKRFGGGSSFGIKRAAPPPARTPDAPKPAQQPAASPGTAAAGGAAAAGGRSWLGPVAGLAAGLGLVALMSHLGLGEELASFVMLVLMAVAAVVVLRLLMRRFGAASGPRPAMAGAQATPAPWMQREGAPAMPAAPSVQIGSALGAAAVPAAASAALPPDFDTAGFERIAKAIFLRMQAANDTGDLDDLRQFTTPEVFAELRLQLQERGDTPQRTDVPTLHAEVIEVAEEGGQQIVSVRYHGDVVETTRADPLAFDEVWHLVRPADGSRAWAIAGVQQHSAA